MAKPLKKKEREDAKVKFLQAYARNYGLLGEAAAAAGVSRQTINNWQNDDPQFAQDIKDIDKGVGEFVVGKLMDLIMKGNVAATLFWIKCRLGWHEKQELEVTTGGGIDVEAAIRALRDEMKSGNGTEA